MDRLEAAEGTQLLDDVAHMVRRYVSAGPAQIDTITLWIVHTHVIKAFYTTGRLYITSPEANCGKSVALNVLRGLVANPLNTSSISAAAMYRSIEIQTPTFLLDEIDKTLMSRSGKDSEGNNLLLAVLNDGYRKDGQTIRCEGPKNIPKSFSTFAPVAMAGITAGVDQPFMTRSIPIMLQRCLDHDDIEEFELGFELAEEFEALQERIALWAGMHFEAIRHAKPERPAGLVARNAEIWLPLMRVALIGGWLERAHTACQEITLFEVPGAETREWEMLRDTECCFRLDDEGFVKTAVLIERLHNLEDSDWQNWNHGRGLTAKSLAKLLGHYGVKPVVRRRRDGEQARGYECDGKLGQVWAVYVDPVEDSKKAAELALPLDLFSSPPSPPVTPTSTTVLDVTRDGKGISRDSNPEICDSEGSRHEPSQNGHLPSQEPDDVSQDDFPDEEPF